MQQAIQAEKQARHATNPHAELTSYLTSPLEEEVNDIVQWLGVSGFTCNASVNTRHLTAGRYSNVRASIRLSLVWHVII